MSLSVRPTAAARPLTAARPAAPAAKPATPVRAQAPVKAAPPQGFFARNLDKIIPGAAVGTGLGVGAGYIFGAFASAYFGVPLAAFIAGGAALGAVAGGGLATGASALLPSKPSEPQQGFWANNKTAITASAAGVGALGGVLGYGFGAFAASFFGVPLPLFILGGAAVGAAAGGAGAAGISALFNK